MFLDGSDIHNPQFSVAPFGLSRSHRTLRSWKARACASDLLVRRVMQEQASDAVPEDDLRSEVHQPY